MMGQVSATDRELPRGLPTLGVYAPAEETCGFCEGNGAQSPQAALIMAPSSRSAPAFTPGRHGDDDGGPLVAPRRRPDRPSRRALAAARTPRLDESSPA